MTGGGAALSRVSSRGRLAAPYPTVPYSTVPHRVLPCSRNTRQSISYPVSLKESQGERKPLWETGENVENSVESVKNPLSVLFLLSTAFHNVKYYVNYFVENAAFYRFFTEYSL